MSSLGLIIDAIQFGPKLVALFPDFISHWIVAVQKVNGDDGVGTSQQMFLAFQDDADKETLDGGDSGDSVLELFAGGENGVHNE